MPSAFFKNSAKICILKFLEYTEDIKRTRKAINKKELQRFESSVLISGHKAFTLYSSFLCLAGPSAGLAGGFVVCMQAEDFQHIVKKKKWR